MMKLRHKFNTVRCERDGIKFASKKERARYDALKLLEKSGEVVTFLRQTPIHLNTTKYICDFLVFWADERVTFEDVKGFKTKEYELKKKLVYAEKRIEITEI